MTSRVKKIGLVFVVVCAIIGVYTIGKVGYHVYTDHVDHHIMRDVIVKAIQEQVKKQQAEGGK